MYKRIMDKVKPSHNASGLFFFNEILRRVVGAFLFINHIPGVGDLFFCRIRKKYNYAVIKNISE